MSSQARPGTSGGIIGNMGSKKTSPTQSKSNIRPQTSSKQDPQVAQNSTTASTNNRSGQTKSLGEESVQRLLKKAKAKSSSRPTSGNKKRPVANSAQGIYDQGDQQS